MRKSIPFLAFAVSLLCCCGKTPETPVTPTPQGPTAITLSPASLSAEQAGGSYDLTVTAPARPTLTLPAWITKTDGTYKDYKITFSLKVAANDSYEPRSADVVVKATGAADVTLKVTQAAKEVINDPTLPDNAAVARTLELGLGWNMGNHFDAYANGVASETAWQGKKATQATFTGLKEKGFSSVRIPVTWMGHIGEAPDYVLDEEWLNRVYEVVGFAENAVLNVILNTHHDEYWLDIKTAATNSIVNEQIKDRLQKTWKQIAEAFKDKGDFLFFETFNEVQDGQWGWGANRTDGGKQYRTLNEWNQVVVDAIRATGGQNATRWIGVPGYASSPTFVLDDNFVLPFDAANRLMVSVHFYDPSDFTLTPETSGKNQWGHTAEAGKSVADSNEEHVVDVFKKLQEKFILNNIPVYIGEYGCVMQTSDRSNKFRSYYLEYVCRAAHTYNLPVVIWDNNVTGGGNEHHGYFNHNDGTYLNNAEGLVQTMIRATTSDDADYTLESIYNKAP